MTPRASALELTAEPMLPHPYTVLTVTTETADTVTLELETAADEPILYTPGQFTMVYAFGVGEVPISIAGGDSSQGRLIHTVRAVGAVTEAICALTPGDQVGIRGAYGRGWPIESAAGKDVVVVAGGIGLAPLRQTVLQLLNNRKRFGAVSLLYGSRSPTELLYPVELRQLRSRFDIEVEVTVDRGDDDWYGDVGLVTNLLPRTVYDPNNSAAFVCGPEVMMKVVARELIGSGMSSDEVYLSMERNMKCAIGFCGHCQYGPDFVCKDGPVFSYASIRDRLRITEQ